MIERMNSLLPEIIEDGPEFNTETITHVSALASEMLEEEVVTAAKHEHVTAEMFYKADTPTQYLYAEMPGLNPEVLKKISASTDPLMREAAARNINCSATILDDLGDDPVEHIREIVANHHGTSEDTLSDMIDDPAFEVSYDAMRAGRTPIRVLVKGMFSREEHTREDTREALFDRIAGFKRNPLTRT